MFTLLVYEGGIYGGEEYRAKIAALSKKKGNHVCSECGEFGKIAACSRILNCSLADRRRHIHGCV